MLAHSLETRSSMIETTTLLLAGEEDLRASAARPSGVEEGVLPSGRSLRDRLRRRSWDRG